MCFEKNGSGLKIIWPQFWQLFIWVVTTVATILITYFNTIGEVNTAIQDINRAVSVQAEQIKNINANRLDLCTRVDKLEIKQEKLNEKITNHMINDKP